MSVVSSVVVLWQYIGGGVLGHGCVQEEILFSCCNECVASLLFCERMEENESLLIIGAERFSTYTGYGSGFRFAGPWTGTEAMGVDDLGRPRGLRAILAIDAIPFGKRIAQWTEDKIARELLKAYAGFSVPTHILSPSSSSLSSSPTPLDAEVYSALSTGNWGCGAFNGDVPLKAFIQLIAAALSGRTVRYFTFGDKAAKGLGECVAHLQRQRATVGEVMREVIDYSQRVLSRARDTEDTLLLHLNRLERRADGRLGRQRLESNWGGVGAAGGEWRKKGEAKREVRVEQKGEVEVMAGDEGEDGERVRGMEGSSFGEGSVGESLEVVMDDSLGETMGDEVEGGSAESAEADNTPSSLSSDWN